MELRIKADIHPPAPVEATAYYVVSEALTNVARYAHAKAAVVHVTTDGEQLVVDVRDDGIGGADISKGSGLQGLRDRVEAIDGRLVVRSSPGNGTGVTARLPMRLRKAVTGEGDDVDDVAKR